MIQEMAPVMLNCYYSFRLDLNLSFPDSILREEWRPADNGSLNVGWLAVFQ